MSDNRHGTAFEKALHTHYKELANNRPMIVHRFQDTKAARVNFLPNQPGDFLVIYVGRPTLIECKASMKHDSLRSCASSMIDAGQLGHHKLWLRAGARCLFVFEATGIGCYEIWRSEDVIEARAAGKPLPKGGAVESLDKVQFLQTLDAILGI